MSQINLMDLSYEEYQKVWSQMVADAYTRSEQDQRDNPDKYKRTWRGETRRPQPSEY